MAIIICRNINQSDNFLRQKTRKRCDVNSDSCRLLCDLPQELIATILAKLPIKTILHCAFVCKEFKAIISDPRFAELHYQNPNYLTLVSHLRYPQTYNTNQFFMIEGYNNSSTNNNRVGHKFASKLVKLCHMSKDCYEVVNSCRGILLLRNEFRQGEFYRSSYFLCNPLTVEFKRVQEPLWSSYQISLCGLGFSPSTKTYKLVRLVNHLGTYGNIEILTLDSTNSTQWRRTRCKFDLKIRAKNNPPLALNGFLYWMANGEEIVCFDIDKEEVFVVRAPLGDKKIICIGVLHGLLGIGMMDVGNSCSELELWVMKEYGVTNLWSKYCVIHNLNTEITNFGELLDMRFMDYFDSGMIIFLIQLRKSCCLTTYDAREKCFKRLQARWVNSKMMVQFHVPSLFSLNNIYNYTPLVKKL